MPEWLSNQGQQRRDAILQLAIKEAADRRRKRIATTTGVTFFGLLLIGGIFFTFMPLKPTHTSPEHPGPIVINPSPATLPSASPSPSVIPTPTEPLVVIERIQTDPQILEKLAIQPEAPRWTTISDTELLDTLAANNHRAAIAEIDGEKVIVSY